MNETSNDNKEINKKNLWKIVRDNVDTEPNPLNTFTTKQFNFRTQKEEPIIIWITGLFEKDENRKEIIYYVLRKEEKLRWSSGWPKTASIVHDSEVFKNLKKMSDIEALQLHLKIRLQ